MSSTYTQHWLNTLLRNFPSAETATYTMKLKMMTHAMSTVERRFELQGAISSDSARRSYSLIAWNQGFRFTLVTNRIIRYENRPNVAPAIKMKNSRGFAIRLPVGRSGFSIDHRPFFAPHCSRRQQLHHPFFLKPKWSGGVAATSAVTIRDGIRESFSKYMNSLGYAFWDRMHTLNIAHAIPAMTWNSSSAVDTRRQQRPWRIVSTTANRDFELELNGATMLASPSASATPACDARSAAQSLPPSPHMPTTCPFDCVRRITSTLPPGVMRPKTTTRLKIFSSSCGSWSARKRYAPSVSAK
mmetsp:Transcript_9659/g.23779  ORF Transcript_9659/g.23779 Transcript_9659/m.23779 type:complete len:300 (+) Transcript_9659:1946-2845(+)